MAQHYRRLTTRLAHPRPLLNKIRVATFCDNKGEERKQGGRIRSGGCGWVVEASILHDFNSQKLREEQGEKMSNITSTFGTSEGESLG